MSEKNKEVAKAKKVLEEISQDEHERYIAELREKYIMDQKAIEDAGYDKGYDKGLEAGIEQGMKQGIDQGKRENTIEIAKKMKNQNIDIKTISQITGLTIKEIEKLN